MKIFPWEIAIMLNGLLKCGMGKTPKRTYRTIYLGEWLAATGRDQAGVAKAGDVDQSYISNMIARRRPNPSAHVLMGISEYIGCTVNDLYRPPPPRATLERINGLSPEARATLLNDPKRH